MCFLAICTHTHIYTLYLLSLHGGSDSAFVASDQRGVLVVKGMESARLLVQEGVVLTNKDQPDILRGELGVVFLLLLFSGWSRCSSGSSGSHDKSCLILLFPVVVISWIFTMNKQNGEERRAINLERN